MIRPQAPLVVLFALAMCFACLDASPARVKRQGKTSVQAVNINNDPDKLFHYSGVQVNVPIQPTIYTVNITALGNFLGDQLEKAIREHEEFEPKATSAEPAVPKSKRSLSEDLLASAVESPRKYKVDLVMKISEVKERSDGDDESDELDSLY